MSDGDRPISLLARNKRPVTCCLIFGALFVFSFFLPKLVSDEYCVLTFIMHFFLGALICAVICGCGFILINKLGGTPAKKNYLCGRLKGISSQLDLSMARILPLFSNPIIQALLQTTQTIY